jgi:glycosyltransferase involved in cell wall biosynthesis
LNDPRRRFRLLVMTYHFPPDGAIGGRRWAGLTKYLARSGWDIAVLTAARQTDTAPGKGITVHTVPRASTLNDRYNAVAAHLRGLRTHDRAELDLARSTPQTWSSGFGGWARKEMAAWLSFPDQSRGWIGRATVQARRLLRRAPPDLVISSGPPHSAHIVARAALAGTRVPHIVDLRDPWVAGNVCEDGHRANSRMRLLGALERNVLANATCMIATTRELADVLKSHYRRADVRWIPNGVDPELISAIDPDPYPGLSIAHIGTLYLGRDLGPVLLALSRFLRRNPAAAAAGTALRVAGFVAADRGKAFASQVREQGLQEFVHVLGPLEHRDAIAVLNRSSLAVVLAQQQPLQVPAKLYEAVGLSVPTLVIAEPDSASAREGERIGALVAAPEETERICSILEGLWACGNEPRRSPVAAVRYDAIATRVDALLREHVNKVSGGVATAPSES